MESVPSRKRVRREEDSSGYNEEPGQDNNAENKTSASVTKRSRTEGASPHNSAKRPRLDNNADYEASASVTKRSRTEDATPHKSAKSLNPWTNKYLMYPVGHPQVIMDNISDDIGTYFGLAKCKIQPPRDLDPPVLPYRVGDKLMFPLCHTCALIEHQETCNHSDEERCLLGTWVTTELQKAVQLGYKIVEMYEVHHFAHRSNELFREYIDTFLKLKQESSGWPDWVTNAPPSERRAKEDEYIRKYKENEGILLDRGNIEKNPGMRALAKLCLNSFWGKFGIEKQLL